MGRGKNTKGAVVEHYKGYNIRMMMISKTLEGKKKAVLQHNGKFGIYAGKNLKQEVAKLADAYPVIEKMIGKTA